MKAYLAGPMRGYTLFNFQEFESVNKYLVHTRGWEVTSPHEIDIQLSRVEYECRIEWANSNPYRKFTKVKLKDGFDMQQALREDFDEITSCDAIIMLKGWQESFGAVKELMVAAWSGLQTFQIYKDVLSMYAVMPLEVTESTLAHIHSAHCAGHTITVI